MRSFLLADLRLTFNVIGFSLSYNMKYMNVKIVIVADLSVNSTVCSTFLVYLQGRVQFYIK